MTGLIDTMNAINGGRGIRCFTQEGSAEIARRVKAEKKRRGIHHAKIVHDEPWYREIEREILRPENEGRLWHYGMIVRRAC